MTVEENNSTITYNYAYNFQQISCLVISVTDSIFQTITHTADNPTPQYFYLKR